MPVRGKNFVIIHKVYNRIKGLTWEVRGERWSRRGMGYKRLSYGITVKVLEPSSNSFEASTFSKAKCIMILGNGDGTVQNLGLW